MKKLSREELTQQPPNVSEFPYMEIITEILAKEAVEASAAAKSNGAQYRFDHYAEDDNVGARERKRKHDFQGGGEKRPAAPCWFCLSNVDAEKHLIVSIGSSCYAAMPKGPLTDDHVLVLTIGLCSFLSSRQIF